MRLGLGLGLVALGVAWGFAAALPRPRPLSYRFRLVTANDRVNHAVRWLWTRLVLADTRRKADIVGMRPVAFMGQVLFGALLAMAVLVVLGVPAGLAWILPALAAWALPERYVRARYTRFQRSVVAGLPVLANHLRLRLDMGETLPAALRGAHASLAGPPRREVERVLSDLERGTPVADAFKRLMTRIRQMEVAVLATVITFGAQRRLSGDFLVPLSTLLAAIRQRESHRVTGQADQAASAVPILAMFGLAAFGLFVLLYSSFSGAGGFL